MTKIDIFSGFLGAGKTTLIKKLIKEAYAGEKLVLIENEFGQIGIDGGFLKDSGVEITEMNSGCICCSLVGDFGEALSKVIAQFAPDRILIEPSGVGKLSDVIRAVQNLHDPDICLNGFTTIVDANKAKLYMKNFGEFFNNQVENASSIILSHTDGMPQEKLEACVALLREHNATATIISTSWNDLDGKTILAAMEQKNTLQAELEKLAEEAHHHDNDDDEHKHHHHHDGGCCGHHHDDDDDEHEHHHDDDDEHKHHHHHDGGCCGHHHDDDDDEHEHHHDDDDEHEHHHHHDGECCGHHHDDDDDEHEHHHDDDDEHEHHHHHDGECCGHHHHHADEVFTSWGKETPHPFTADEIRAALEQLSDSARFGQILRAKGIVAGTDGRWIHFDYVPGEPDVRFGSADIIGRLCVIGSKINEDELGKLFGI